MMKHTITIQVTDKRMKRLQKIANARGLTVQELLYVALDREEAKSEDKGD